MTPREQLLKEIAQSADAFVEEVLNFVLFTKSRRSETSPDLKENLSASKGESKSVNQLETSSDNATLASNSALQTKNENLHISEEVLKDIREEDLEYHRAKETNEFLLDRLQEQTQDALKEAGYDTREKIVQLVQEVKREMIVERQNHSNLFTDETKKQLTD
ncbi:MAG: hypothetical protein SAL07_09805 [Oscillatoria sp. PMC 1051.18]|nr:hypothetical protein [Oscillatoria sp. PMC 1050.18]MEC5030197.1 hypothetical protein [Oscillatoria sp. PMC 1051.18]